VWAESKVTAWLWARHGLAGTNPLFAYAHTPRASAAPSVFPLFGPTGPPGAGHPRLKESKVKHQYPRHPSSLLEYVLGGGGADAMPRMGHWRRLLFAYRLGPFPGWARNFAPPFGVQTDWKVVALDAPGGSDSLDAASAVLAAWHAESGGWNGLLEQAVWEFALLLPPPTPADRARVHWKLELEPLRLSALIGAPYPDRATDLPLEYPHKALAGYSCHVPSDLPPPTTQHLQARREHRDLTASAQKLSTIRPGQNDDQQLALPHLGSGRGASNAERNRYRRSASGEVHGYTRTLPGSTPVRWRRIRNAQPLQPTRWTGEVL
jgi:hypothetical protein